MQGEAKAARALLARPARAAPAAPGHPPSVMALHAVEALVRAQSVEVLGRDIGLEGHFSEGGIDSLSAMELAASIGRAARVPLPGAHRSTGARVRNVRSVASHAPLAGRGPLEGRHRLAVGHGAGRQHRLRCPGLPVRRAAQVRLQRAGAGERPCMHTPPGREPREGRCPAAGHGGGLCINRAAKIPLPGRRCSTGPHAAPAYWQPGWPSCGGRRLKDWTQVSGGGCQGPQSRWTVCPAVRGGRMMRGGCCAGTFAFDYPSVKAAARHVHSLLAAAGSTSPAAAGPLGGLAAEALGSGRPEEASPVSVTLAGRLPAGVAAVHDAISAVPLARWDLEAPRQGKARPAQLHCMRSTQAPATSCVTHACRHPPFLCACVRLPTPRQHQADLPRAGAAACQLRRPAPHCGASVEPPLTAPSPRQAANRPWLRRGGPCRRSCAPGLGGGSATWPPLTAAPLASPPRRRS